MKLYLSSYKLGNETETLKSLIPFKKIGYIPNALDFTGADPKRREAHIQKDVESLKELDVAVEIVNLRDYFGKQNNLRDKLKELGAIFVSGGNTFVLRQAMKLSGLDEILLELNNDQDFLYAGYSAAGCVLSPTLKSIAIVDDATDTPYEGLNETIWEGLGLIDFVFMPHWDSDHPESEGTNKEIEFCKQNSIPFRATRDGEVIILPQT